MSQQQLRGVLGGLFFGLALLACAPVAMAEIDGHGPDAWRVTGVASTDVLNARMGPGTEYPVMDSFAADEGGLQQVTCVPLLIGAAQAGLTDAQRDALPPRWCLMRSADFARAGWVAQRYITPDTGTPENAPAETTGDAMIDGAVDLVRRLYDAQMKAHRGEGNSPLMPSEASNYFSSEVVEQLRNNPPGADPLFNAQDFDGGVTRIAADPETPMFRGTIMVNVDFTNFGKAQRAIVYLRSDTMRDDAAVRVISIDQGDWGFP